MDPNVAFAKTLAFLVILLMCSDHLRSSDIVTPKYFADGTLSSTQPWR